MGLAQTIARPQLLQWFMASALALTLVSCSSVPKSGDKGDVIQSGRASWYGQKFHGRKTASGERYNMQAFTAAHRSLPFGTWLLVRSKSTGRSVRVRVNDRGPYSSGRILDLSYAAASRLGMIKKGEDEVVLIWD